MRLRRQKQTAMHMPQPAHALRLGAVCHLPGSDVSDAIHIVCGTHAAGGVRPAAAAVSLQLWTGGRRLAATQMPRRQTSCRSRPSCRSPCRGSLQPSQTGGAGNDLHHSATSMFTAAECLHCAAVLQQLDKQPCDTCETCVRGIRGRAEYIDSSSLAARGTFRVQGRV
jgi:hypothetical protein